MLLLSVENLFLLLFSVSLKPSLLGERKGLYIEIPLYVQYLHRYNKLKGKWDQPKGEEY